MKVTMMVVTKNKEFPDISIRELELESLRFIGDTNQFIKEAGHHILQGFDEFGDSDVIDLNYFLENEDKETDVYLDSCHIGNWKEGKWEWDIRGVQYFIEQITSIWLYLEEEE